MGSLEILSQVVGWAYFVAWSISFYPQVILNYKRLSVTGLSLDFIALNLLGFTCYSFYNITFLFSTTVRDEYRTINDGQDPLVTIHDVLFACHATLITMVTAAQCLVYQREPAQRISKLARAFVMCAIVGVGVLGVNVVWGHTWVIDVVYFTSYVKMAVSTIKYVPQAYLNYKRKSTIGWSIINILLDFTGGILSLAQLFIDASIQGGFEGIVGDPVKFGLGFISILFDIIFIFQHYVLYPRRFLQSRSGIETPRLHEELDESSSPLLNGSSLRE
ncbi:hypothetical protein SmJEL517_g04618 [Synchytrium microbalum]|uniref:Cystinosin n=1 Tax=Synchytrium microbalum TaxID=1806994 RepID=A0A507BZ96_9FUNG|nr:uncharacterized protein SmJEL517_g04618 [Synchytrium microbalum]TPX32189.1 hypothetical protein SmJEL517_g04618 [Synchytrium microbalum]